MQFEEETFIWPAPYEDRIYGPQLRLIATLNIEYTFYFPYMIHTTNGTTDHTHVLRLSSLF